MKLSEELFMMAVIFVGMTAVCYPLGMIASLFIAMQPFSFALSAAFGAMLYSVISYHILHAFGRKDES